MKILIDQVTLSAIRCTYPLDSSATYPIWTPYDVPEATVATLASMLEQGDGRSE